MAEPAPIVKESSDADRQLSAERDSRSARGRLTDLVRAAGWRASIPQVRDIKILAGAIEIEPLNPRAAPTMSVVSVPGGSRNGLARDLRVPVTRMSEIVNGRRSIPADTALRLARYLDMTPQFWMNLQAAHEARSARRPRQESARS
jgi:addiction module HigA family antidote